MFNRLPPAFQHLAAARELGIREDEPHGTYMKRGFGARATEDPMIERRARCFNLLWSLKMGAWDKSTHPEAEGDAVLEYWGFRLPQGEGAGPEIRFPGMPRVFRPSIHTLEFCGYPTEGIDGNVLFGDTCELCRRVP